MANIKLILSDEQLRSNINIMGGCRMGDLYYDLLVEIDILDVRIRDLEAEYKFWYQSSMGARSIPLDTCLDRMKRICDQVEMYSILLDGKEKAKVEIEKRMSSVNSIEDKVAFMRDVEGKTLPEIAADLNFSYSWVKKLSMKTSRKPRNKKGTHKELTG